MSCRWSNSELQAELQVEQRWSSNELQVEQHAGASCIILRRKLQEATVGALRVGAVGCRWSSNELQVGQHAGDSCI